MEQIIKFFIQLSQLFEIAEQEKDYKNSQAIHAVAKMYLKQNNVDINQIQQAVDNDELKGKFENIDSVKLLINYINWKK